MTTKRRLLDFVLWVVLSGLLSYVALGVPSLLVQSVFHVRKDNFIVFAVLVPLLSSYGASILGNDVRTLPQRRWLVTFLVLAIILVIGLQLGLLGADKATVTVTLLSVGYGISSLISYAVIPRPRPSESDTHSPV